MSPQDVGGVTCWTALVGLAVERGWTVALIGMAVVGFIVYLVNSGTGSKPDA